MIGFALHGPVVVLGALTGILYGLLAVGLVLVYRSNRVVNFAHGEMGAFGASLFSLMVVRWGMPYWTTLPIALVVAGAVGSVTEDVAIRRLRRAPAAAPGRPRRCCRPGRATPTAPRAPPASRPAGPVARGGHRDRA